MKKTPPPTGSYSVAIEAGGLVFLAGPDAVRDRDNVRHGDKPFAVQLPHGARQPKPQRMPRDSSPRMPSEMEFFCGTRADAKEFDAIYRDYVSSRSRSAR